MDSSRFLIDQHRKILKVVAIFTAIISVSVSSYIILLRVSSGNSPIYPGQFILLGLLVLCGVSFQMARVSTEKSLRLGSYLLLISLTFTVFVSLFLAPLERGATPTFYLLIVLLVALLLSARETVAWTIACFVMLTINFLVTTFIYRVPTTTGTPLPVDVPLAFFTYIIFAALIIVIGVALYYFVNSLVKALQTTESRSATLENVSQDREKKRQAGLEISQDVSSSSLQLAQTALQQSHVNTLLAGAVSEVASGMSQINFNALKIAQATQQMETAMQQATNTAITLTKAAQQAGQSSQEGRQVVVETVSAISRVDLSITNLQYKLEDLTNNASQINQIITLINEIANETHLLALNAAIESAGAGEYGNRFSVVASEVKNLSNRTLQAAREVRNVIGNAKKAIDEAAQAVQEGATQTETAVVVANKSGQVVEILSEVLTETVDQVTNIYQHGVTMSSMVQNIAGATQQQQLAAQQMLFILEKVQQTSNENVAAINQINSEASSLQSLSERLAQALVA